MDIEGVIVRQSPNLDWSYIREQLAPLAELKERQELLDPLEQVRRRPVDRTPGRAARVNAPASYCNPPRTDVIRWVLNPSQCMRPT